MKKSIKKIISLILCLTLCFSFTIHGTANATAATGTTKQKAISNENQLETDLAEAYNDYSEEMGGLEGDTREKVDGLYSAFVEDNNKLLSADAGLADIFIAYCKIKKNYYISLYKLCSESLSVAGRIISEYETKLNKFTKDYKKYGMTHKAVLKQVKEYLAYAEDSSCIQGIKTSINETKNSIKDIISESLELVRDGK